MTVHVLIKALMLTL